MNSRPCGSNTAAQRWSRSQPARSAQATPSLASKRFACLTDGRITRGGQPHILPGPSRSAGEAFRGNWRWPMKGRKTDPSRPIEKLKRKIYERELAKRHAEMVPLEK